MRVTIFFSRHLGGNNFLRTVLINLLVQNIISEKKKRRYSETCFKLERDLVFARKNARELICTYLLGNISVRTAVEGRGWTGDFADYCISPRRSCETPGMACRETGGTGGGDSADKGSPCPEETNSLLFKI